MVSSRLIYNPYSCSLFVHTLIFQYVIPAQAGIFEYAEIEIPACAGMTHLVVLLVFVFCFQSPTLSQSTKNN